MSKKLLKKFQNFLSFRIFYVNFQNVSLILNEYLVYFFDELPIIASHQVTQVYSSHKVGIIHG